MKNSTNEFSSLGQLIGYSARSSRIYMDEYLDGHLDIDLTSSEGSTLRAILFARSHGEEITSKDVMDSRRLGKAAASYSLSNLEKKGYIRTVQDQKDRRKKLIDLTEEGERIYKEFEKALTEVDAQLEKGFSKEELKQFVSLLERYVENAKKGAEKIHENR
jgi:DNA-binding MarR family transcriptional regulator